MRSMHRFWLVALAAALISACGADYEVGDTVLANYQQRPYAYAAKVTAVGDEEITVQWLDESGTESLPLAMVKEFDWDEDSDLECAYQHGDTYLPGEIDDFDNPKLHFEYENGEEEDTEIAMCRELVGEAPEEQTASSDEGSAAEESCPGPGLTRRCNGVCVNIQEDDNNCGGCGVVCPSGKSCDGHLFCRDADGNL